MIIELKNISKSYKTKYTEVQVLNKASLSISKGDFISIVGSSGCGKSTLLNLISTIDLVDEGIYNLNGREISNFKEKELAQIRNTEIGFIYQNFALIDELSVLDNVIVPIKIRKLKKTEQKRIALNSLELVGLKGLETKKIYELSGGQRQRIAIARTLAQNTNIILADEPTGNLDKSTGQEIMNLLIDLNKEGKTIILVTHDLELAKLANKQITIINNKICELK